MSVPDPTAISVSQLCCPLAEHSPFSRDVLKSLFSTTSTNKQHNKSVSDETSSYWKHEMRKVLKLAYERRWVAEWLFEDCNLSVFRNDFILPPNVFSNIIPLVLNLHYQLPGMPNRAVSCRASILYIPVCHHEGVTVGYAVAFSHIAPHGCASSFPNPFTPPFMARMSYEHSTNSLLLVGRDPAKNLMGVHGYGYSETKIKANYTFTFDTDDYNWNNLPTEPKHVIRSLEFSRKLDPLHTEINHENLDIPPGASQPSLQDLGANINRCKGPCCRELYEDVNAQYIYLHDLNLDTCGRNQSLPSYLTMNADNSSILNTSSSDSECNDWNKNDSPEKNLTRKRTRTPLEQDSSSDIITVIKSHMPWRVSSGGITADGTSWMGENSFSAFNMGNLSNCIADMEKKISRRAFGPERRIDEGGLCPLYQLGLSAKAKIMFDTADKELETMLSNNCKQIYYQLVFATMPDVRLLSSERNAKAIAPAKFVSNEESTQNMKTYDVNTQKTPVCDCGQVDCPCAAAKASKRAKIREERKKRNRLSAARSNARRKEGLAKLKEDLKNSKIRLEELKNRRTEMMQENKTLRQEVLRTNTVDITDF